MLSCRWQHYHRGSTGVVAARLCWGNNDTRRVIIKTFVRSLNLIYDKERANKQLEISEGHRYECKLQPSQYKREEKHLESQTLLWFIVEVVTPTGDFDQKAKSFQNSEHHQNYFFSWPIINISWQFNENMFIMSRWVLMTLPEMSGQLLSSTSGQKKYEPFKNVMVFCMNVS